MDPTKGVTPPSLTPGFSTGVDNMGGSSKFDGEWGDLSEYMGEHWG